MQHDNGAAIIVALPNNIFLDQLNLYVAASQWVPSHVLIDANLRPASPDDKHIKLSSVERYLCKTLHGTCRMMSV